MQENVILQKKFKKENVTWNKHTDVFTLHRPVSQFFNQLQ